MKYRVLTFIFLITLLSCKNTSSNKSDQIEEREEFEMEAANSVSNNSTQQKSINFGKLDKKLSDLINEVKNEFPLKELDDNPKNVHQSYYVAFFKTEKDSIVAICRQPFVMDLFPDFAFKKEDLPRDNPVMVGMVNDTELPIFIFDSGGMGNGFYKDAKLKKDFPEKYLTADGKYHDTIVPPIFRYKIESGNFKFLGKSKVQRID